MVKRETVSEFEGKSRKSGIPIPPHEPTASEELMLTYRTGEPTGALRPDDGSAFNGEIDPKQRPERS